jgi:hypothetical protein
MRARSSITERCVNTANDAGIEMVFLRSYVNTAERVIGTLKGMLFPA